MMLRPCSDVSASAWITSSDLPWHQLVTFGPSGFDAYARLKFLPDPLHSGQPEVSLGDNAPPERELLRATLEVLRQHTAAPDDVYFCLWDGWGPDGVYPASMLSCPKVEIPNRSYFLLRGALSDIGNWDDAEVSPGDPRLPLPEPAFVWPADHAWCIANDVDPHYAGIGASAVAIDQLLAHAELDVEAADPQLQQPYY